MKKRWIQIIVTAIVIIVALAGLLLSLVWERISPSKERIDAMDYFQTGQSDELVMLLQNQRSELNAWLLSEEGENIYIPYSLIKEELNSRFYWDESVQSMVYTDAYDLYKIPLDSMDYTVNGETRTAKAPIVKQKEDSLYMELDFVQQYSDFYYEQYESPKRINIFYKWEDMEFVTVEKDGKIRELGGIKSSILADAPKGTELYFSYAMDEWTCVQTKDGFVGYIENDCLGDTYTKMISYDEYEAPVYPNISKEYKINMAWHYIGGNADDALFREAMDGVTGMNTISPVCFFIQDNEGNLESRISPSYVEAAHEMGIEVWAAIQNMEYDISTNQVLSNMASREHVIDQLMNYVLDYQIDGINIDIEELSFDAADGYIQFIRELSIRCRANQIVLSIDNYVPTESSFHYDRKEQGIVADYIVIMGYDEHYAGVSEAGSTASIGFVRDGIVNTLKEVPAEKVINAIPFYTRIFIQTPEDIATSEDGGILVEDRSSEYGRYLLSSEAVTMSQATQRLSNNGVSPVWNEALGQYYGEYELNGKKYLVWLEDETSIGLKMELIQEYGLAGVAEWNIEQAKSGIWDVIQSYLR